jgi:outer membrane murein-binding lipoprotein Lpp
MLSHLESTKNQPESYGKLVFDFIRETDRFIDAVGQRAATIRSRTDSNANDIVHRISESRIASKQLSASLANLNRALSDASFQNAILGIQRALNEIIWKFAGIRRYCLGLKMKGQSLPTKSPLNHMVNQLDGEVYRAIRKITDSLELASERYYGLERVQDEHFSLYDSEKELELFEYYEPAHEATFILLESQKYHIREILNLYGIEPKPFIKRPKQHSVQGFHDSEYSSGNPRFATQQGFSVSDERISQVEQVLNKRISELQDQINAGPKKASSEQILALEAKIHHLENELSRTVLALQSRTDELNMHVRAIRNDVKAGADDQTKAQLVQLVKADEKRRGELQLMYNQLKQLMEINDRMQLRLEQTEDRMDEDLKPILSKVEEQKRDQDVVATQIDKILVIINEKYAYLESRIPNSNEFLTLQKLKPELDKISRKIDDNTMRMNELFTKVKEVEHKHKTLVGNLNERFNTLVLMLREEMNIISKKKVDAMLRKFIDFMKGTNGEQKVHK